MSSRKKLVSEINITNLVDVTFVLLIIFIMLAPVLESGIDLTLPETSNTKMDVNQDHVILSLNKSGALFWNKEKITLDIVESRVKSILSSKPQTGFLICGDEEVSYGHMAKILDLLRNLGVSQLDLATRVE